MGSWLLALGNLLADITWRYIAMRCFSILIEKNLLLVLLGSRKENNPCANKVCPEGKVCKIRGSKAKCVCSSCHGSQRRAFQPVCGTDGKGYINECDLKREACKTGRSDVEVAYNGTCQSKCMSLAYGAVSKRLFYFLGNSLPSAREHCFRTMEHFLFPVFPFSLRHITTPSRATTGFL